MGKKLLFIFVSGLLALTVLGVFLLVVLPDRVLQEQELEEVPDAISEPSVTFIDPVRGSTSARVSIVEYGDYACGLCKTLEPTLTALVAEAPRQRQLVWKDAPNVGLHPEAFDLAMAARCAQDQGVFWEYHDQLMSTTTTPNAAQMLQIAEALGMDGDTFTSCMASEAPRPIVQHTLDEAIALQITSTPALFLNGVLYEGPMTAEAIREAVEAL